MSRQFLRGIGGDRIRSSGGFSIGQQAVNETSSATREINLSRGEETSSRSKDKRLCPSLRTLLLLRNHCLRNWIRDSERKHLSLSLSLSLFPILSLAPIDRFEISSHQRSIHITYGSLINFMACSIVLVCQSLGTDVSFFAGVVSVHRDRHLQCSFERCRTL